MKIRRLTLIALLPVLCLIHPLFGDTIPTEGRWGGEYYRPADTNRPPITSIEGDIFSSSFGDALSDLTVCVMNDEGVKVYESVVSSEANRTCSFSLTREVNGQHQVMLLHRLGHLTDSFTLE